MNPCLICDEVNEVYISLWIHFCQFHCQFHAMDSWRIPLGIRCTFDCWQSLCIWALTAVCCAAALRTCLLTHLGCWAPNVLPYVKICKASQTCTILNYTKQSSNPKQKQFLAARDVPPRERTIWRTVKLVGHDSAKLVHTGPTKCLANANVPWFSPKRCTKCTKCTKQWSSHGVSLPGASAQLATP